jgi:hypothetical protein
VKKKNRRPWDLYHYGFGMFLFILLILLTMAGCRQDYSPKPDGYLRIDPHPEAYKLVDKADFPLSFEISQSAQGIIDNTVVPEWINIVYPRYKATVYCSYIPIDKKNRTRIFAESKELVYRHGIKAEKIQAQLYENPEQHLYATLYLLAGNAATPLQFTVTDSISYLFRGALYFDIPVKRDSVAPVIEYITQDIMHLIETVQPQK